MHKSYAIVIENSQVLLWFNGNNWEIPEEETIDGAHGRMKAIKIPLEERAIKILKDIELFEGSTICISERTYKKSLPEESLTLPTEHSAIVQRAGFFSYSQISRETFPTEEKTRNILETLHSNKYF